MMHPRSIILLPRYSATYIFLSFRFSLERFSFAAASVSIKPRKFPGQVPIRDQASKTLDFIVSRVEPKGDIDEINEINPRN